MHGNLVVHSNAIAKLTAVKRRSKLGRHHKKYLHAFTEDNLLSLMNELFPTIRLDPFRAAPPASRPVQRYDNPYRSLVSPPDFRPVSPL